MKILYSKTLLKSWLLLKNSVNSQCFLKKKDKNYKSYKDN